MKGLFFWRSPFSCPTATGFSVKAPTQRVNEMGLSLHFIDSLSGGLDRKSVTGTVTIGHMFSRISVFSCPTATGFFLGMDHPNCTQKRPLRAAVFTFPPFNTH